MAKKGYNCWICRDEGIILYKRGGIEYACSCICKQGIFASSDIPPIDALADPQELKEKNKESSINSLNNKNKCKEIIAKLKQRKEVAV